MASILLRFLYDFGDVKATINENEWITIKISRTGLRFFE